VVRGFREHPTHELTSYGVFSRTGAADIWFSAVLDGKGHHRPVARPAHRLRDLARAEAAGAHGHLHLVAPSASGFPLLSKRYFASRLNSSSYMELASAENFIGGMGRRRRSSFGTRELIKWPSIRSASSEKVAPRAARPWA
jgi:hypothetical protein